MRAITVRQPWAWAIIHGGKDVENRTRNIAGAYRGPVVIHAGLEDAVLSDEQAITFWQHAQGWPSAPLSIEPGEPMTSAEPHGAIIGVVDLVDVHHSKVSTTASHHGEPVCFDDHTPTGRLCSPWAQVQHHHLVLRNPRPLPEPIPYRGALGLWTLPDDVLSGVTV